jgi:GntR family transcriptional repressor for pyruvate dehydrogenase complex
MNPMSKKILFTKPVSKQTMAEQMAGTIQELILDSDLESGEALPTEPELAEQFGVSRAVVRDATRILMARGLVEVQHGRGVFVTEPENEAFGEALLLALRRVGASAWDVEQFEQMLIPEVVALAAASATDEEVTQLRQLANEYIDVLVDYQRKWWGREAPAVEQERFMSAFQKWMKGVFRATHNKVIGQLAQPLINLRNLRSWAEDEGSSPESISRTEAAFIERFIGAIESRDPEYARAEIARLLVLPPEAIKAMRDTPVGEISEIPVPPPKVLD